MTFENVRQPKRLICVKSAATRNRASSNHENLGLVTWILWISIMINSFPGRFYPLILKIKPWPSVQDAYKYLNPFHSYFMLSKTPETFSPFYFQNPRKHWSSQTRHPSFKPRKSSNLHQWLPSSPSFLTNATNVRTSSTIAPSKPCALKAIWAPLTKS